MRFLVLFISLLKLKEKMCCEMREFHFFLYPLLEIIYLLTHSMEQSPSS
jgi:hypothetical protein